MRVSSPAHQAYRPLATWRHPRTLVEEPTHRPLLDNVGPKPLPEMVVSFLEGLQQRPLRAEASLPNLDRMPRYKQQGNGCGTTGLAMVLTYLQGTPTTQAQIDRSVRRMNVFASPHDLIDGARVRGLAAEGYNKATWPEMLAHIDRGTPVQALIKSDRRINYGVQGPHYVVITGYDRSKDTVTYRDPNGWEKTVSTSDFDSMWRGVGFGIERYFITYGKQGTRLPPGRDSGAGPALHTLNGVANLTNGLSRMGQPKSVGEVFAGLTQFAGGLMQTLGSGAVAVVVPGAQRGRACAEKDSDPWRNSRARRPQRQQDLGQLQPSDPRAGRRGSACWLRPEEALLR